METISKSDCQKVGFIRKIHGVHGELVLEYEPEFEESVAEAERFFLEIDGLLVPFFVAEGGLRFRSAKTVLVTFDWVKFRLLTIMQETLFLPYIQLTGKFWFRITKIFC